MKRVAAVRPRAIACGVVGALAAALLVGAPSAHAAVAAPQNAEVVADGSWCWFQDPRAVHFVGAHDRTYIGYVTSTGDIDVVSQDAATAVLTHTTLHPQFQADDHAAPGIVVLPHGFIAVFYSAHNGSRMLYRISARAEDISVFGPELMVPTNTGGGGRTYANPIYLPAEHRLYLFFRGGDYLPAMTSTTDFVNWSPAVTMVIPQQQGDPHVHPMRPYVKYSTNRVDTIGITFTDGHPRDVATNSVYAMTLKGGVLRAPNGEPLSVPDPAIAPDATAPHEGPVSTEWLESNGGLVYRDPGNAVAWLESMALDAQANPVIVYSTYEDTADAQYRYARWTGAGWADIPVTDAGGSIALGPSHPPESQYSGGADIDQNAPGTIYLSRETTPTSGVWRIEHWQITDDGASLVGVPTQDLTVKNVRPVVPWGTPGSEVKVLWMSGTYVYWAAGYRTQLRELTSGRAPTTARISASAPVINAGAVVAIGGRAAHGYLGAYLKGATVDLVGHTAGQADHLIGTAVTDATGLVSFTVRLSATMRFTVRVRSASTWGPATSPSTLVTVRQPSLLRISTSSTAIHRGQSVVVGVRAVDARSGAYLPYASIELWQHIPHGTWYRVGAYAADRGGFAQTVRKPSVDVAYQARLLVGPLSQAAVSRTAGVDVS